MMDVPRFERLSVDGSYSSVRAAAIGGRWQTAEVSRETEELRLDDGTVAASTVRIRRVPAHWENNPSMCVFMHTTINLGDKANTPGPFIYDPQNTPLNPSNPSEETWIASPDGEAMSAWGFATYVASKFDMIHTNSLTEAHVTDPSILGPSTRAVLATHNGGWGSPELIQQLVMVCQNAKMPTDYSSFEANAGQLPIPFMELDLVTAAAPIQDVDSLLKEYGSKIRFEDWQSLIGYPIHEKLNDALYALANKDRELKAHRFYLDEVRKSAAEEQALVYVNNEARRASWLKESVQVKERVLVRKLYEFVDRAVMSQNAYADEVRKDKRASEPVLRSRPKQSEMATLRKQMLACVALQTVSGFEVNPSFRAIAQEVSDLAAAMPQVLDKFQQQAAEDYEKERIAHAAWLQEVRLSNGNGQLPQRVDFISSEARSIHSLPAMFEAIDAKETQLTVAKAIKVLESQAFQKAKQDLVDWTMPYEDYWAKFTRASSKRRALNRATLMKQVDSAAEWERQAKEDPVAYGTSYVQSLKKEKNSLNSTLKSLETEAIEVVAVVSSRPRATRTVDDDDDDVTMDDE